MANRLEVRLFGRFQVERGGHPVKDEAWRGRKTRDLLKILLLARGRHVPKDSLLEELWPESPRDRSESNLHSLVSNLRRILEPDLSSGRESAFILTLPEGYSFDINTDTSVDLFEFEKSLGFEDPEALDKILAISPNDLLEENPYDDWAERERDRLRGLRLQALVRIAHASLAEGSYDRAIRACEKVVSEDPTRESVWRVLMKAYAASGDRAAALDAFDRCRTFLTRDLGVDPMVETIRLHQTILQYDREDAGPSDHPQMPDPAEPSGPTWLFKLGAIGSLAWVGLTVLGLWVSFYSLQSAGFVLASDPASEVLPRLAAQSEALRVTLRSWPILLPAGLLLLPAYLAWFKGLAMRGALAWLGVSFGVIDALGQTLSRVLVLGRLTILPQTYLQASQDQRVLVETLWDLSRQLSSVFGVASVMAHPIAVCVLCFAAWRSSAFPAWLTRSGTAIAITNLAYSLLIPPPALGLWGLEIGLVLAIASYSWLLGLGWSLWNLRT